MTGALRQRGLCSAIAAALATAYFLVVIGNARAADPVPGQQASTDQAAAAIGSMTQEQPQNLVVTIRLDSPGSNGPIVQTNTGSASAGASNGATTDQAGLQGGDQSAATGQDAGAGATATQSGPQNIVIVIRVNSPGANGPIVQGNDAAANAAAANASATQQGGLAQSPTPRAAYSRTSPSLRPRPSVALAAVQKPQAHAPRVQQAASRVPHAGSAVAEPSAAPAVMSSPTRAAPAKPLAQRPAVARTHAPASGRAAGRAAVLDRLAPPLELSATRGAADVSGAVALALLGVLGALLAVLAARRPLTARLLAPRGSLTR